MMPKQSRLTAFISELRRRRVFRVAAFYGGIAFVIIQIIDGTFDLMGVPEWAGRMMVVLLVLGFPISMILAWVFDITDEGIVKTKAHAPVRREPPRPIIGNTTLGVVASVAILVAVWSWWDRPASVESIASIAVLPLTNMMNDPDQEYFVDGMHEALTAELSKISALRVIGRTSTLAYKGTTKSMSEIATELGVDALIEGSVVLADQQVRVTAQLIAANPERHLWADDYVRGMEKVLALHKDIAKAIAQEIRLTITPKEEAQLASVRQVDPEAYKAYLKGTYFLQRLTKEGFDLALDHFRQALKIDPNFAPAYAGIASTYINLADAYLPPSEAYPKVGEAAEKAILLDETLADAHVYLAAVRGWWEWNWDESRREIDRAFELNPNNAEAYLHMAYYWIAMDNLEQAFQSLQKAQELAPLSTEVSVILEYVYAYNNHFDAAIAQHETTQNLSPGIIKGYYPLGQSLIGKGLNDEGIRVFEEAERDLGRPTAGKGVMLARMGRQEEALEVAQELEAIFGETYNDPVYIAAVYAAVGDKERAYAWLDRAVEERSANLLIVRFAPGLEALHGDQRFKDILKRVGLE
jgi:TolB-like protein/Flp pilus assembly protein TadD